jgi:hypothetical protein
MPPARSPVMAQGLRRARTARAVIAAAGIAVFVAGAGLARASYAGHAKHRTRALAAPRRFMSVVQDDLLRSGVVAPAQAPPQAATSAS